jgi:hypothetical protein
MVSVFRMRGDSLFPYLLFPLLPLTGSIFFAISDIAGNCTSFDGWGNQIGGAIIWSYLFLFLHFYYNTYRAGRATRAANAAKATAKKIN